MASYEATPLVNRAESSKNPYIKSQAASPVAWQLLDEETISRSITENKLIFLHIGYSACHYCHLMATESFAHPECARILNDSFIPIIVDREERPDLDSIYMNYVQALNGSGGWPINVFLTPDLVPVFGGTYWPGPGNNSGGGAGGGGGSGNYSAITETDNEDGGLDLLVILTKLRNFWREQEDRCRKEAAEVLNQLRIFAAEGALVRRLAPPGLRAQPAAPVNAAVPSELVGPSAQSQASSSELDLDQIEEASTHMLSQFDEANGGFGLAPKFPTPPKLTFLLRLKFMPPEVQDVVDAKDCEKAFLAAQITLRKIRDGGLRDHVGGQGFARYSITEDWSVPQFEKLVVDNALLLGLYLDAWLAGGARPGGEFLDVVLELAEYLSSSPVFLPCGAFATSEAADSYYSRNDAHLREGAYHLWTRREFDLVIGDQHASSVAAARWNVLEHGNVDPENDPNDEFMNRSILRVVRSVPDLSRQFGVAEDDILRILDSAKAKLRAHREKERPRPAMDDKVISGWNGIAISSLARCAAALSQVGTGDHEKYLAAAVSAATFVRENLWDADSKLLYRVYREGRGAVLGFAEDYAYMIDGLIELYSTTGEDAWLKWAEELQNSQITQFFDQLADTAHAVNETISPAPSSTHLPSIISNAATPPLPTTSCGGFYSTLSSAPHTILRLKEGMDTALPSTNGVSAQNLFRLGLARGDAQFTTYALQTVNAFEAEVLQHPWLFPTLLVAVAASHLGGKVWQATSNGAPSQEPTTQTSKPDTAPKESPAQSAATVQHTETRTKEKLDAPPPTKRTGVEDFHLSPRGGIRVLLHSKQDPESK